MAVDIAIPFIPGSGIVSPTLPMPSAERQFRGIHDDGDSANEGILRTKLTQDGLVRVPFTKNAILLTTNAPSSINLATGADGVNPDGSLTEVTMVAAPGAPNGSWVEFFVQGRIVGISFVRYAGGAPFDVMIDGACYAVDDVVWQYNGTIGASFDPSVWIVADDLPDGLHKVSVMVAADPAGLVSNRVRLLGFLAERRAGYRESYPLQMPLTGTLATALALIPNALTTGSFRSLRRIDFLNSGVGTATVTVEFNSHIVWQQTVAVGAMATYDPGDQVTWDGALTTFGAFASIAGVTYAAYGRS